MSDAYNDSDLTGEEAPRRPNGASSPFLDDFQKAVGPAAPEQIGEVTTRLNDYFQRRDIAISTAAAGDAFVRATDRFKSGLVSMVQADPHAMDAAMDVVPPMLDAIISTMPVMPPDAGQHHAILSRHHQSEIAAAAITSMAENDEGLARSMLGDERVVGLLGENAGALGTYISLQAQARAVDAQVEAENFAREQSAAVDRSAFSYLAKLYDPAAGGVAFPSGWNQAVIADPGLPPAAKVAVSNVYQRLRTTGDATASDPMLVGEIVNGLAQGRLGPVDILPLAGTGLRLHDALALGARGQSSAADRAEMGQLAETLDAAQRRLLNPDNGPAGVVAYGRFVNWLLPAYRAAGNGSLDYRSEGYLLAPDLDGADPIERFTPRGEDFLEPFRLAPETARPSLANIFGGTPRAGSPTGSPALDTVYDTGMALASAVGQGPTPEPPEVREQQGNLRKAARRPRQ